MSDFKFSCSNCGQHLSGDERYAGLNIVCPACGKTITVPTAPAPVRLGTPPGPLPPPSSRPVQAPPPPRKTCGLAIASLVCSIGSFIIIPFGFIPGIICGHMAKKKIATTPGLGGRGLAKAGLIIGYIALGINVVALTAVVAFFTLFAARIKEMQAQNQPPRGMMR